MIFDRTSNINSPLLIEKELKALFRVEQALTIFEIGACEGEDSVKYSRLFPNSKIFIFEPLPGNIQLIKNNLEKYSIKNVSYFNKALSAEIGTADFYVSKGRPKDAIESDWDYGNKSSSLLPPGKHLELTSFIEFDEKIEVETVTLNAFCKENNINSIDFIHMDVQGAELMVLEGAKDFIKSIKAVWLEVSKVHLYKDQPLVDDVFNFMTKNDFVLAKECIEDVSGDQLYLSKKFFPNYKDLTKSFSGKETFFSKFLKKIGLQQS